MKPHIPILIGLATIGIGVELWLQHPAPTIAQDNVVPAEVWESTDQTIKPALTASSEAELANRLQQEIETRKQLEKRLEKLEQRVTLLESENFSTSGTPAEPAAKVPSSHSQSNVPRGPGFNAEAMLAAGIEPAEVKRIQQLYDDVEMQKLYLRDQAVREGWAGQKRYSDERKALNDRLKSLRSELSEKDYDAYLYATGQRNRIIVQGTMNTSPAQAAGIQAGDTIVRYDNKPIYSWSDLRNASTQCVIESTVAVEIKRADTTQHIYIPCGPLGVRINTQSQQAPRH